MAPAAPYARFEDYAARYGAEGADRERVGVLLADASAIIGAMLPAGSDAPSALLESTACAMVNRAMACAGAGGIAQCTQTAGAYTESLRFANPHGDLYLTQAEKDALGIGGGLVGCLDLGGGGRRA